MHLETLAMAQKKQNSKADLVFEFVGKLPVIKIAMSDNRESRPIEVKRSLWRPRSYRKDILWGGHWTSGPN